MPNWVTFEKRRTVPASDPFITLLKTGVISMNAVAYETLGRPRFLEFLFDADARMVGLRPRSEETEFTYPIRELKSATGGTFSASAKAFMLYFDIPMERSIRRRAEFGDGVLSIDLNDPGVDVTTMRGAS